MYLSVFKSTFRAEVGFAVCRQLNMHCYLPKVEVWMYFVLWISGVVYALYHVYLSGIFFDFGSHSVFSSGWSFINRKKDVSDYEWAVWAQFLYSSAPWMCAHLVVAEIVRYSFKELLSVWYLTISMLYLLLHVGSLATLFMLIEPCLMYLLLQFRSRVLIYIAGLFFLVFHNIDSRMYVIGLGGWAHYGIGYGMGLMFQMKYVVTYGLSCTLAQAEQVQTPSHPKCIGRIHLYSDMWRHFDQGLYFFLRKYIYIPMVGERSGFTAKLLASLICFTFICAWHGVYMFVLVWSALNFLGITIEAVSKAIASSRHYQQYEKLLTPQNVRRFHALIATPLFMMSALSNFYFFAGMSLGNHFMWRLFQGSLQENGILFLLCYCCSQVSIEVKNWEQRKQKKQV